jgi:predicted N-acyltransferase
MKSTFIKSLSEISSNSFKEIINENDKPFMSYEYLNALEQSRSVHLNNGWETFHLTLNEKNNLLGFLPIYKKNNSHGEFVFDHQWSYALRRAGRDYYPKLISAIPFTPCETRKFVMSESIDIQNFIEPVVSHMKKYNVETWHILFPDKDLSNMLDENNFIERDGYRFVWNNKEYQSFDDFLNIFTSRQRKNIKSERKKIQNLGIKFSIKDKANLTIEDWHIFFEFYKSTYHQRMQAPYLNFDFFNLIHGYRAILNPVIIFAEAKGKKIAGSLCFQNKDTLYGRHWGSSINIDSLHFECCYYQGIEYCIKNNISYFDPGVQGEHKIRRGFEPKATSSYHYVLKTDFRDAIKSFCQEEKISIEKYLTACSEYTPIKKEYRI